MLAHAATADQAGKGSQSTHFGPTMELHLVMVGLRERPEVSDEILKGDHPEPELGLPLANIPRIEPVGEGQEIVGEKALFVRSLLNEHNRSTHFLGQGLSELPWCRDLSHHLPSLVYRSVGVIKRPCCDSSDIVCGDEGDGSVLLHRPLKPASFQPGFWSLRHRTPNQALHEIGRAKNGEVDSEIPRLFLNRILSFVKRVPVLESCE